MELFHPPFAPPSSGAFFGFLDTLPTPTMKKPAALLRAGGLLMWLSIIHRMFLMHPEFLDELVFDAQHSLHH